MRADKAFSDFVTRAERLAIRDKAEQSRLVRLAQEGDIGARKRLIEGMILWTARCISRAPFTSPTLEPLEMISIGLYGAPTSGTALHGGVNRAIDLWDPKRGVPFHIFATPQIMTALRRACWRDAVVRIPQKPLKRGERAPMTGVTTQIAALQPTPEEAAELAELERAVERLPKQQREIVRTRFGLTGALRIDSPPDKQGHEITATTLGRSYGKGAAWLEEEEEAALDALYAELTA